MPDKKSRLGKPRITDNKQVEHPQVTLERAERQASREFRGFVGEQIARNARLGTHDPSKGNEPASETKFQFTSNERRDVLRSLPKEYLSELDDAALEEAA